MSSSIAYTGTSGKFLFRYGDQAEWQTCSAYDAGQKIASTQRGYKDIATGSNRQTLSVMVDFFDQEAASDLKKRFAAHGRAQKRKPDDSCLLETLYGDGDSTRRSAASSESRTNRHSASLREVNRSSGQRILGLRLSPFDGMRKDIVPIENLRETTETSSPLVMHWGYRINAAGAEIPQVTQPVGDSYRVGQLLDTISQDWWRAEDSVVLRQGRLTDTEASALDIALNSASWKIDKPPTLVGPATGPLFEVESFLRPAGRGWVHQLTSEVGVWSREEVEKWTKSTLGEGEPSKYLALRISKL